MPVLLTYFISAILGTLSGLGIGGGSLLMLWLTLVLRMDYTQAKYINLLFFLPPAAISTGVNLWKKRVSFSAVLPAALAGSFSVLLFTKLSSGWDTEMLRKLFGALLLCTALRELLYKRKQRNA